MLPRLPYYLVASAGLLAAGLYLGGGHAAAIDTSGLRIRPEIGEEQLAGTATVRDTGRNAYGRLLLNVTVEEFPRFLAGRIIFEQDWGELSPAPLGPRFNARSCNACHRRDGRGRPTTDAGAPSESIVFQLSSPDPVTGSSGPDPLYGEQLNLHGVGGLAPEGRAEITYDEVPGQFADGEPFILHKPVYGFRDLVMGSFAPGTGISPRIAPASFGLGLLEAVPESLILSMADPGDRDGDGISGRPNYVPDRLTGRSAIGRFGWKANQPTLRQQIAHALVADLGVTTAIFPDDGARRVRPAGDDAASPPEMGRATFDTLLLYIRRLTVPMRRRWREPTVLRGKAIFSLIGCAGCHLPTIMTGSYPEVPEAGFQKIHPYTDLLLHDMGEGLADGRPDGMASGGEWRTPPLWGIGLSEVVNGSAGFLHDGRARSIEEAILWHGGEGGGARSRYLRLRREDRAALLAFMEAL
jgi:CxxC motif-containing protein (DUF1111 family)